MSKQTINIGASPNDGTGTPLRTSFDYTNQNFTELYTALGGGVGLPGATTQVIFNDGGTNLAGDAGLVYNKTTDTLTAGNATITGDLTVDTSTLKVDSANDRVGIQSTLLNSRLTVRAGTIAGIDIYRDDANANFSGIRFKGTANSTVNAQIGWNGTQLRLEGTDEFLCATNSSDRFRISSTGVFTFETVGGVAGTAMTLNSTGLNVAGKTAINGASLTYDFNARASSSNVGNTAFIFEQLNGTPILTVRDNGTVLISGDIRVGNTVSVVSPTAPNRTIAMIVNGVTLYIAAKTTND